MSSASSPAASKGANVEPDPLEVPRELITLVANMTNILNALIRDDAESKRRLVATEAGKLYSGTQNRVAQYKSAREVFDNIKQGIPNPENEEETAKAARLRARGQQSYQRVVIAKFKERMQKIIAYLESKGFKNLDTKTYTDQEIQAIAKPLNEGS